MIKARKLSPVHLQVTAPYFRAFDGEPEVMEATPHFFPGGKYPKMQFSLQAAALQEKALLSAVLSNDTL